MINSKKLGISGGILWSLSMFICTILGIYTGFASEFLHMMSGMYLGYSVSWPGAFIGLVYGFADGFFGLYLLAWIYNKLDI
jgi:hypothetical protein